MGIKKNTAGLLAAAAAGHLIVAKPTPELAVDQALAFQHFRKSPDATPRRRVDLADPRKRKPRGNVTAAG